MRCPRCAQHGYCRCTTRQLEAWAQDHGEAATCALHAAAPKTAAERDWLREALERVLAVFDAVCETACIDNALHLHLRALLATVQL